MMLVYLMVCVCRLSGCAGVHWVASRGVGRAASAGRPQGAVGSPLVGSQEPWGASPGMGVSYECGCGGRVQVGAEGVCSGRLGSCGEVH